MPKRLTASGEAAITGKNITMYSAVVIDGATNTDVASYSYSKAKEFGTTSIQITLNNENGKYGSNGASPLTNGDSIVLREGLYNNAGSLEVFDKFTGTIRHIVPKTSGSGSQLEITAVGPLAKLDGLDIDKLYESGVTSVENMPLIVGGGSALVESTTSTKLTQAIAIGDTHIHVESNIGFEAGSIMIGSYDQVFTGASPSGSDVTLITIAAATRAIVKSESVYQKMSQRTSTQGKAHYFDFGYWDGSSSAITANFAGQVLNFHAVENIRPTRAPIIMIKPTAALSVYNDPEYDGFNIDYATGQISFGRVIDVINYEVWSKFDYYTVSTMNYGEDIIEDILLEVDGYGNYPYTTTDFTTTLLVEDGTATDSMTYNREATEIDGLCYDVGRVWYTKYNNVSTVMDGACFTIPAGKTFSSFSQRYGRVILDSAVTSPTDGDVVCLKNYTFKTLQATGVKIPVIDFRTKTTQNRFTAIQDLRKQLAPNYVIYEAGDGKIWGKHLRQRVSKDYELQLMGSLNYENDTEVYTRVKLFGENAVPKNILIDGLDPISPYNGACSVIQYVTNYPLMWTGRLLPTDYGWYEYTLAPSAAIAGSVGKILFRDADKVADDPVIWINGTRNTTWSVFSMSETMYEKIPKDIPTGFLFNGGITGVIDFMVGTSFKKYFVSNLTLKWRPDRAMYEWKPLDDPYIWRIGDQDLWSSQAIANITSVVFQINNASDAWRYAPSDTDFNRILVNKKYTGDIYSTQEMKQFVGGSSYVRSSNCAATVIDEGSGSNTLLHDGIVSLDSLTSLRGTLWPQGDIDNNYMYKELVFSESVYISFLDIFARAGYNHWTRMGVDWAYESFNPVGEIHIYYHDPISLTWKIIDRDLVLYHSSETDAEGAMHKRDYSNLFGTIKDDNRWINQYRVTLNQSVYADKIRVAVTGQGSAGTIDWRFSEIKASSVAPTGVTADFWYNQIINPPTSGEIKNVHDGNWSTQLQSIYQYEPVYGTNYLTFNLKKESDGTYPLVEAIDIAGGWYVPNPENNVVKFDITNTYSIQYMDGSSNWYPVCKESETFSLSSGEVKSFNKDVIGEDFHPVKLAIILNKVNLFDQVGNECYPVALTEFCAYKNVGISAEAKLITVGGAVSGNNVQDPDTLLTKFGDKLYKVTESKPYLNTESLLGDMAKLTLEELCKNITMLTVPVYCRPDANLGDTVLVNDTINGASNTLYFVDSLSSNNGTLEFRLAKYWTVTQ